MVTRSAWPRSSIKGSLCSWWSGKSVDWRLVSPVSTAVWCRAIVHRSTPFCTSTLTHSLAQSINQSLDAVNFTRRRSLRSPTTLLHRHAVSALVHELERTSQLLIRPTSELENFLTSLTGYWAIAVLSIVLLPSVLWRCWLGGRKGIRPAKNWVVGCWHGYLSGARCRVWTECGNSVRPSACNRLLHAGRLC